MSEEVEQVKEETKEQVSAEESAAAPPKQIALKDGSLAPANVSELMRTIENIARGGGFPARLDTPQKRVAAYNLAHSLMGAQWQLALNHIAIIHGQMCIYGELPGSLAERTGEVEERHVYVIDDQYNKICTENKNLSSFPYAGVIKIKRKGREMKEYYYTIDQAKNAGQYPAMKRNKKTRELEPNPDSPWMKFTTIMLMRKAQAIGVKIEFPEAFVGVPIAEYDFDMAPDLKDVTPSESGGSDRAKELNLRFTKPVDASYVDQHAESPAQ